ncbi:DUF4365 domain-containing protein [Vibrio parahaemolyticus]|uniref:DUF4365 domain-containing protein n=1 Tax=Vibrio parahaemolyticus TaxID=670 RepID=UPI000998BC83|nr:DUF4365 domain-containing protein [Vibrio parahaemolyticus]MDF4912425.1 DUF4365 domain-containing protein [Vibrio parahaemolyticus]OOX37838.1 hypothetical protein BJL76_23360 [Vibrio parahaemolyticus]OOX38210.1 hypothetical protein BJL76_23210 [Vibrio parahaemolyticus]OOX38285.1 hypothetical protein BJL76_23025 [Vibrio parahaemolyticus]OOX38691.1 hypothetical protein BJL76_22850 [Vibrio parahaemolyticus]
MKYSEDTATGDTGEYFLAYTVSRVLEWPCRLFDIDIGIDAQIEVLDDDRHSMGQFIAVQVKTTKDKDKSKVSVESKHIEYWASLDIPVIIAFVNLSRQKVYVRSFEDFNGSQTIHFSEEHELNCPDIKKSLRLLSYSKVKNKIITDLAKITSTIRRLLSELTSERVHEIQDCDHYIDMIGDFESIKNDLHEVKVTLDPIHPLIGNCNYKLVLDDYFHARDTYIYFLRKWSLTEYNDSEVSKFESEYGRYYSYLELSV